MSSLMRGITIHALITARYIAALHQRSRSNVGRSFSAESTRQQQMFRIRRERSYVPPTPHCAHARSPRRQGDFHRQRHWDSMSYPMPERESRGYNVWAIATRQNEHARGFDFSSVSLSPLPRWKSSNSGSHILVCGFSVSSLLCSISFRYVPRN